MGAKVEPNHAVNDGCADIGAKSCRDMGAINPHAVSPRAHGRWHGPAPTTAIVVEKWVVTTMARTKVAMIAIAVIACIAVVKMWSTFSLRASVVMTQGVVLVEVGQVATSIVVLWHGFTRGSVVRLRATMPCDPRDWLAMGWLSFGSEGCEHATQQQCYGC